MMSSISRRLACHSIPAVLPLAALLALPVRATGVEVAGSEEVSALRQEISALKQTVERLDNRVQNLERRLAAQPEMHTEAHTPQAAPALAPEKAGAAEPAAAPESVRTPGPQTTLREHWQKIKRGIRIEEAETLLGRPDRTVKLPGKTIWYYIYPDTGNGSVVFTDDGEVSDWQTPPFSTWAW